jgi:hypothetical protein
MKGEYHLDSNEKDCLEIELASAFLEEVFQALAKEVHDHNVEHFVLILLFISNEVKVWHACFRTLITNLSLTFASKLVDELALPEKHYMPLILVCFLLFIPFPLETIEKGHILTTLAARNSPVRFFSTIQL